MHLVLYLNLLYLAILLNALIRFAICKILLSENGESFTCSFPIWLISIPFSCLSILTGTSNTMLNRSDKSGHIHLFPELRGKVLHHAVQY